MSERQINPITVRVDIETFEVKCLVTLHDRHVEIDELPESYDEKTMREITRKALAKAEKWSVDL